MGISFGNSFLSGFASGMFGLSPFWGGCCQPSFPMFNSCGCNNNLLFYTSCGSMTGPFTKLMPDLYPPSFNISMPCFDTFTPVFDFPKLDFTKIDFSNIWSNNSNNLWNDFSPNFSFNNNMWGDVFSRRTNNDDTPDGTKKPETENYRDGDTSKFSYDAKELKSKWDKKKPNLKLSQEFFNKVVELSKRVQCDPNDLMGVMNIETAGTFSPTATNPKSGTVGLIQFHPDYVSNYGTSIAALKKMTREEQLTYVEKYITVNKKQRNITGKLDAATLYALIFTPAWAKKDVLARRGQSEYNQNKVLDKNKDGVISKADLGSMVRENQA